MLNMAKLSLPLAIGLATLSGALASTKLRLGAAADMAVRGGNL